MDIIMRLCNNYFEYLGVNFTEKFLRLIKKKKKLDSIGIQKKMIEIEKEKSKGNWTWKLNAEQKNKKENFRRGVN